MTRIPRIKHISLDFSQFHPLDHRIGSRYCREVTNFPDAPHGWPNVRLHFRYWYDLKYAESDWYPKRIWRRATRCLLGLHEESRWFRGVTVAFTDAGPVAQETATFCRWCHKELEAWRPISPEEDDQGEIRP